MTEQSTYSQSPMGRMGEPPSGPLDYVIVAIAVVFVAAAAIQTVRRLIHPGEDAPDHIKRSVLLDDPDPRCLGGPGGVVGVCPPESNRPVEEREALHRRAAERR